MDTLRLLGVIILGQGVFVMVVARTAFRKGERWSWYLLCVVPLVLLYSTSLEIVRDGSQWPVFLTLVIISLLGLSLSFRQFFPKR